MKKILCVFLTLIITSALCSCTESPDTPETTNNAPKLTLDDFYFYDRIEPVGEVPENFLPVINNNVFYNSVITSETVLRTEASGDIFIVYIYDHFGNIISQTEFEKGDYFHLPSVFPTTEGNYLILFEIDYTREEDKYYIKDGSASKLVKIDKNGTIIFETDIDDRINGECQYLLETENGYVFAGSSWRYEAKHIGDRTTFSRTPSDILLTFVTRDGKNVKYANFEGSNSESINFSEYKNGEIILYIYSGSEDGDYPEKGYWKFIIDESLDITEKIKIEGSDIPKKAIGYLNGRPIYSINDFIPDFDAGGVTDIIEYDNSILIVSSRAYASQKSQFEKGNPISYFETVYSCYSEDGKLIWRNANAYPGYITYSE